MHDIEMGLAQIARQFRKALAGDASTRGTGIGATAIEDPVMRVGIGALRRTQLIN
jgi:hypothetical protein